ncbi:MAG: hypothetical protein ACNA7U_03205 [Candidatus Izemoplasmataceae bacterium]
MLLDYISFILLLFFMTFFVDIFRQYFKTRMIIPRKMMTAKEGGLFQHYIIVGILTAIVLSIHLATGLRPFAEDNILSNIIQVISFSIVGFIFIVFIFVFVFYFIAIIYAKITKIEDKAEFFREHTHKMITTAFVIATVSILLVLITTIIGLLN